jgi:hypothetical protein
MVATTLDDRELWIQPGVVPLPSFLRKVFKTFGLSPDFGGKVPKKQDRKDKVPHSLELSWGWHLSRIFQLFLLYRMEGN